VPCAPDVAATACLKVRIVSRAETAGDGFCQLRLAKIETNGEDVDVWGERFSLTDVAAGAAVDCEPGLRL